MKIDYDKINKHLPLIFLIYVTQSSLNTRKMNFNFCFYILKIYN